MKVESLEQLVNDLKDKELFETIGVGVGVMDTNFRILYQNRLDKELKGDHTGKFCYQAYENRESVCGDCPLTLTLKNGRPHTRERSSISKHGTSTIEIVASSVTDKTGKIIAGIEIVRDITKRRQAEEELRFQSEIMTNMSEAVYLVSMADGTIVYTNSIFEKLFGYGPGEMIGKHVSIVNAHTEKQPEETAREIMDILNVEGSWRGEVNNIRKDGTPFWSYAAVSVFDHSKFGRVLISVHTDITERKLAEERLAASEKKYRLIFDNAPLGIFHFDKTGQVTACNQYFADIIGAPIAKTINFNLLNQLKDVQMKAAAEAALYGRQGHYEGDYLSVVGNKTTYVKADFAPVLSKDGVVIGGMAIFEDITERKQIEQSLVRSRAEFATMFNAIPEAVIMTDIDRRIVTINPAFTKLFGYTLDEIKGRSTEFLCENKEELLQQDCVRYMMKSEGGDTSLFEVYYRRKDGSVFPAESIGVPIKSPTGAVTGYIAVHRDISERKRAEERIIHERDFSDTALNSLPGIFYMFDRTGKFTRWNKNFETVSEYTPDEIAGMSPLVLFHGDDRSLIQQRIQEGFVNGFSNAEAVFVSKSGKQTPYYFTGKKIQVEGKTYLIGMGMDITERKQMEKRLEDAAVTDELTGLTNRRGFYTFADQQCRMADRSKRGLSLLFVDLDNMKQINDELGHETGDLALKDTAYILKKTFRESDIIARMGGDEFAVLITEPSRPGIEHVIMDHLKNTLAMYNEQHDRKYELSLSMGISNYDPYRPCTVSELLTRADALMYADKKRCKSELASLERETERRSSERLGANADYAAELNGRYKVRIKDISMGGICLKTSAPVKINSTHTIIIRSPDTEDIEAGGIVVWSSIPDKGKGPRGTETGLRFVAPSESEKNALHSMIKHLTA